MSILIRGIDMPTDGRLFAIIIDSAIWEVTRPAEGGWYFVAVDGARTVQLPPHGRLIDADALEKHIKKDWEVYDQWIADVVENRPTVLEAEEGE